MFNGSRNGNGSSTNREPAKPVTLIITGKTVAHSVSWSKAKRARLAAQATLGEVIVTPLTAVQAANVFGVTTNAVAMKRNRHGLRRYNGNGHTVPTWDALSPEQKSEFLQTNFNAIWAELDQRTAA